MVQFVQPAITFTCNSCSLHFILRFINESINSALITFAHIQTCTREYDFLYVVYGCLYILRAFVYSFIYICLNFLESHHFSQTHTRTPALWQLYYLHTLCRKGTTQKSCSAHHFFSYTKMPWSVCFFCSFYCNICCV